MKPITKTKIKEYIILKIKEGEWNKDTKLNLIVEEILKLFPNVINEKELLKKIIEETLTDVKQKGANNVLKSIAVERKSIKSKENIINKNQGNSRPNKFNNNIEHLKSKISPIGVFKVNPKFSPNASFLDSGVIKGYYAQMIGKKVLEKDQQLLNDIIKHRKEILQYRTFCTLGLYSKGKQVASLKVHKILIENGVQAVNFWYGKNIDTSTFPTLVMAFNNYMSQFGISNTQMLQTPNQNYKVDDVTTEFDFA